MLKQLNLSFVFLLIIGGCTFGQPNELGKNQFNQLISKELEKSNYNFVFIQQGNNTENVFTGKQRGSDWVLQHKTKSVKIEKVGNKVRMDLGKHKETLNKEQFGIISPSEHLELVRQSTDKIELKPNVEFKNEKVNHVMVTIKEKKLEQIIKSKLHALHSSSDITVTPYLSGKIKVIYDLYYSPKLKKLVKLEFTISSSLKKKNQKSKLIYLF